MMKYIGCNSGGLCEGRDEILKMVKKNIKDWPWKSRDEEIEIGL